MTWMMNPYEYYAYATKKSTKKSTKKTTTKQPTTLMGPDASGPSTTTSKPSTTASHPTTTGKAVKTSAPRAGSTVGKGGMTKTAGGMMMTMHPSTMAKMMGLAKGQPSTLQQQVIAKPIVGNVKTGSTGKQFAKGQPHLLMGGIGMNPVDVNAFTDKRNPPMTLQGTNMRGTVNVPMATMMQMQAAGMINPLSHIVPGLGMGMTNMHTVASQLMPKANKQTLPIHQEITPSGKINEPISGIPLSQAPELAHLTGQTLGTADVPPPTKALLPSVPNPTQAQLNARISGLNADGSPASPAQQGFISHTFPNIVKNAGSMFTPAPKTTTPTAPQHIPITPITSQPNALRPLAQRNTDSIACGAGNSAACARMNQDDQALSNANANNPSTTPGLGPNQGSPFDVPTVGNKSPTAAPGATSTIPVTPTNSSSTGGLDATTGSPAANTILNATAQGKIPNRLGNIPMLNTTATNIVPTAPNQTVQQNATTPAAPYNPNTGIDANTGQPLYPSSPPKPGGSNTPFVSPSVPSFQQLGNMQAATQALSQQLHVPTPNNSGTQSRQPVHTAPSQQLPKIGTQLNIIHPGFVSPAQGTSIVGNTPIGSGIGVPGVQPAQAFVEGKGTGFSTMFRGWSLSKQIAGNILVNNYIDKYQGNPSSIKVTDTKIPPEGLDLSGLSPSVATAVKNLVDTPNKITFTKNELAAIQDSARLQVGDISTSPKIGVSTRPNLGTNILGEPFMMIGNQFDELGIVNDMGGAGIHPASGPVLQDQVGPGPPKTPSPAKSTLKSPNQPVQGIGILTANPQPPNFSAGRGTGVPQSGQNMSPVESFLMDPIKSITNFFSPPSSQTKPGVGATGGGGIGSIFVPEAFAQSDNNKPPTFRGKPLPATFSGQPLIKSSPIVQKMKSTTPPLITDSFNDPTINKATGQPYPYFMQPKPTIKSGTTTQKQLIGGHSFNLVNGQLVPKENLTNTITGQQTKTTIPLSKVVNLSPSAVADEEKRQEQHRQVARQYMQDHNLINDMSMGKGVGVSPASNKPSGILDDIAMGLGSAWGDVMNFFGSGAKNIGEGKTFIGGDPIPLDQALIPR